MKPLLRGRFGQVYRYAESHAVDPADAGRGRRAEGAVAVAEEQTEGPRPSRPHAGRPRQARASSSRSCSCPPVEPPRLPELSLVAGGAVAAGDRGGHRASSRRSSSRTTSSIGSRKVAGILAESSEGRVVLGIGVNVNQTAARSFRPDAQTQPTSLRIELGEPVDRARLLAAILLQLERAYDAWVLRVPQRPAEVAGCVAGDDANSAHARRAKGEHSGTHGPGDALSVHDERRWSRARSRGSAARGRRARAASERTVSMRNDTVCTTVPSSFVAVSTRGVLPVLQTGRVPATRTATPTWRSAE